jgi:hypothetical protein
MANENTRQQPSGFGTFVWAIFFFFLFTLLVVLWVRGSGPKQGYEDKRAEERIKIREEVQQDAAEKLSTVAIVDKEKGIARIPIADAKKSVIAELKAKKVGPSQVKVDPWLPMPPPADPNATEPPPPALPSAPQGADTVRFELAQPVTK